MREKLGKEEAALKVYNSRAQHALNGNANESTEMQVLRVDCLKEIHFGFRENSFIVLQLIIYQTNAL